MTVNTFYIIFSLNFKVVFSTESNKTKTRHLKNYNKFVVKSDIAYFGSMLW